MHCCSVLSLKRFLSFYETGKDTNTADLILLKRSLKPNRSCGKLLTHLVASSPLISTSKSDRGCGIADREASVAACIEKSPSSTGAGVKIRPKVRECTTQAAFFCYHIHSLLAYFC